MNSIMNRIMNYKLNLSKKELKELIILILIRYLYLFLTVNVLKDLWYVGSGTYGIDFNINKDIIASITFLFITFYYVKYKNQSMFINVFLNIIYILYFIPLNASFSINNMSIMYYISSNLYFGFIFFLLTNIKLNKKKNPETNWNFADNKYLRLFFFILCIMFIIYKLFYNGFSLNLTLNSDLIYSNRAEYTTFLDTISGSFISYFISILKNLISYVAPIYLFISLEKKRLVPTIVSFICLLSIFSVSSSKNTIFFIIIVIIIYIMQKLNILDKINEIFDIGMLLFLLICVLLFFMGKNFLYILIIRRIMYIPAWLNSIYYDYFISASPVCWSQDTFILQNILPSAYDTSPLNIISNIYFNGEIPSPNTGMFAEAIMHFHYIGIFIYPILIYVLIKASDFIYSFYTNPIKVIIAIKLVLQITNVSIVRTDFILSYVCFSILLFIIPLIYIKFKKGEKLCLK